MYLETKRRKLCKTLYLEGYATYSTLGAIQHALHRSLFTTLYYIELKRTDFCRNNLEGGEMITR